MKILSLYAPADIAPGRSLYFAYGSNMDEAQMACRCPEARLLAKVIVPNWRFALDEAGVATLVPKERSCVEGLLWSVTPEDVRKLDRYEGVAAGCYRKETFAVDDCRTGCEALVYLSNRSLTRRRERSGYMERIIRAAVDHGFSDAYIEMLRSFCREDRNV